MSEAGYYRHPTIHGNRVVFVSEDDLWELDLEGGTARRLTSGPGTPSFPCLSPEGTRLAYTGRDDGPDEVYLMDAGGGPARRLTWMGARTLVVGWSGDGTAVLAATDWQQPFSGFTRIARVPVAGGTPEFLDFGPARAVSFSPASAGVVIGRNSGDPSRWKRYRGGTAGTLWVDRQGRGTFNPLIELEGNLANPMWIGSRIYFLSDHDGHGNLYSCTPSGRGLRQHTHHSDYYVRFPSTDGRRIVYHSGADLWMYDPASGEAQQLEARIRSSRSHWTRRFVSAEQYWESSDLHPAGHTIASIHRGGLFTMGLWEGAPVRLGAVSRVRHRLATWLGDGERIVAVSDEGGEEALVVIPLDPQSSPRRITGDFGRPLHIYAAPHAAVGKKKTTAKRDKSRRRRDEWIALTNHRHELIGVNLTTGRVRVLDRSPHRRIAGLAWSPDGKWLAYGYSATERSASIRLVELASGRKHDVTGNDFFDGYPSFDPEGRYLYFLSWRTFNPVYDSMYFDLGFPKGSRPHLVPLRADIPSPFETAGLEPRGPVAEKDDEDRSSSPPEFGIDLDGIGGRIVAFPLPEGRYGRILGVRGRALYSSYPVTGSLGGVRDPEGPSGVLDYWDFERRKSGRVAEKISDFQTSLDARVLAIIVGDRFRVVAASYREDPDRVEKDECTRETGWVDLDRIPLAVVPADEWRQMYSEAWRLQREHFWRPDMSGTDWEEIHERYLPLLERVGSRAEFSDLMWEVQGELGTSHCYEMGGDYRGRPNWRQGYLGADFEFNRQTRRWRIAAIPKGDGWDTKNASPLAAPGVGLQAGDEILGIGADRLSEDVSIAEKLVNMADREVRLRVRRRRGRGWSRDETVAVRALSDETGLRYRDWVESNREWVHDSSRGRVGYLHIPDMGPAGYAEFHRYFSVECDREGLIVDVRFNRGGHVSQLLLEKLLRRRIAYDISRWSEPLPYPDASPMGPMVALTNEHAGSDGDVFCHAFKLYNLGPLIGKRTWGGVIGIWPRHALVDGTITTQPEYASWFFDVGFDVENYGTDPDIEIENQPHDYAAGRDRQLEKSLQVLRGLMREHPPRRPARPKVAEPMRKMRKKKTGTRKKR